MIVLDKLLAKLYKNKHQVLIFSQFTQVLDLLHDYFTYREYAFCRIDGNTIQEERDDQIADFIREDSEKFIFMLSTRAGGLGINLYTADTVILFDSDWNPQVDLQAMDRCHRLGQKRCVVVYRLITKGTIEEQLMAAQRAKMRAAKVVVGTTAERDVEKGSGVQRDIANKPTAEDVLGNFNFLSAPDSAMPPSSSSRAPSASKVQQLWDAEIERGEHSLGAFLASLTSDDAGVV